jgi:hypothetical protein
MFFHISFISYIVYCSNNLEKAVKFLCEQPFNNKGYIYSKYFNDAFIKAISQQNFQAIINSVTAATGFCKTYTLTTQYTPEKAVYKIISNTGDFANVILVIEGSSSKISGFLIQSISLPSKPKITSLNDAQSYAQTLQGNISFTIANETQVIGNYIGGYNNKALGSAFKLYILYNLVKRINGGEFKWEDYFPLNEEWKSLPSGVMHTFPAGKLYSLYDYAQYMINISDNTATDHLIHILQRKNIESTLSEAGAEPSLNVPFLLTSEMFKLKWAISTNDLFEYLKLNSEQKRYYLENVIWHIPLSRVGTNGISMNIPYHIDDVEWFASSDSVCYTLFKVKTLNNREAMNILSVNVPIIEKSNWSYSGFKGGSEAGVLTLHYLLKHKFTNKWVCLSYSSNNNSDNINEWLTYDFVNKLGELTNIIIESSEDPMKFLD